MRREEKEVLKMKGWGKDENGRQVRSDVLLVLVALSRSIHLQHHHHVLTGSCVMLVLNLVTSDSNV